MIFRLAFSSVCSYFSFLRTAWCAFFFVRFDDYYPVCSIYRWVIFLLFFMCCTISIFVCFCVQRVCGARAFFAFVLRYYNLLFRSQLGFPLIFFSTLCVNHLFGYLPRNLTFEYDIFLDIFMLATDSWLPCFCSAIFCMQTEFTYEKIRKIVWYNCCE